MPVVRRLDQQRLLDLGLEKLRPWDTAVDPKSRPPLRPFDAADIDDFLDKTQGDIRAAVAGAGGLNLIGCERRGIWICRAARGSSRAGI